MLVEVSDFECPFCCRYARETEPLIVKEYVDTGKIRYAFVHMPIEARHKNAFHAGEAAACAGDQGQYWPMHHRLFAHQAAIAPMHLPIHAQALDLRLDQFKTCLDSGRHATDIRRDFAMAQQAGVTGTPTFFIGLTDPGSLTLRVSARLIGAKPFAIFKSVIDPLVASAATKAPR